MNQPSPYNANPELTAMKLDVADRNYSLRIKSMIIGGLSIVAGLAVGAMIAPILPAAFTFTAIAGGGIVGLLAGSSIAEMATMKERTKLKIDEEMVQSYMSGKNYWGEGFREEVAEHGYAGAQQPHHGGVPHERNTAIQKE